MRMPGIAPDALAPHLEAIRQQIADLPEEERRPLMQAVNRDTSIRNDRLNNERAERAEREMRRPRVDPRQMRLEGAA